MAKLLTYQGILVLEFLFQTLFVTVNSNFVEHSTDNGSKLYTWKNRNIIVLDKQNKK
jgi:hypothetical protein